MLLRLCGEVATSDPAGKQLGMRCSGRANQVDTDIGQTRLGAPNTCRAVSKGPAEGGTLRNKPTETYRCPSSFHYCPWG